MLRWSAPSELGQLFQKPGSGANVPLTQKWPRSGWQILHVTFEMEKGMHTSHQKRSGGGKVFAIMLRAASSLLRKQKRAHICHRLR